MLRPILWTRWLLVRVVTCAVLAVVLTVVLVGGDDLVLGRTLFATLAGALVGLFTVAVLTRWDVFATADDLDV